ncbi:MAG: hypothetical protein AAF399_25575 [Bacteroidota bacterium]
MNVSITKRHIKSAQLDQGRLSPLEIALVELDVFEQITIIPTGESVYHLDLDGTLVPLPARVSKAMTRWETEANMKPLSFELAIESDMMGLGEEDFLVENFEDGLDFGFSYAY